VRVAEKRKLAGAGWKISTRAGLYYGRLFYQESCHEKKQNVSFFTLYMRKFIPFFLKTDKVKDLSEKFFTHAL